MAANILLLLLASGILADGLLEEHLDSGPSSVWTNKRTVESNEDDNGILKKNKSVMENAHQIVKIHQDDSEFISEHTSAIVNDQQSEKTYQVTECDLPFEAIGESCYYFSEERGTFEEAEEYCENISLDHSYQSSLAMLDYAESENQALFDAVTAKENLTYWIGGKTEDGSTWTWLDGRHIYLQSPYWYVSEPNEGHHHKCAVVKTNPWTDQRERSYLFDHKCNTTVHFICQAGCPSGFQRIGKHCYWLSEDVGFGDVTWQNARDFCQALSVPVGHYADLAVLGLPTQNSYHLMRKIGAGFTSSNVWLGAFTKSECDFAWVDGRNLSLTSVFWGVDWPHCCEICDSVLLFNNDVIHKSWISDNTQSSHHPFVCQMFPNE